MLHQWKSKIAIDLHWNDTVRNYFFPRFSQKSLKFLQGVRGYVCIAQKSQTYVWFFVSVFTMSEFRELLRWSFSSECCNGCLWEFLLNIVSTDNSDRHNMKKKFSSKTTIVKLQSKSLTWSEFPELPAGCVVH